MVTKTYIAKEKTTTTKSKKKSSHPESSRIGSSKIRMMSDMVKYYDLPPQGLTTGMVLHKMSEVLELYLKIIQQILQPEEFHSLHECAVFDDGEKSKLFELYGRVIIAHREILRALIFSDEKNNLSTIQLVHSEILAVKPMMLDVVKKMQHSWKEDLQKKTNQGIAHYFG